MQRNATPFTLFASAFTTTIAMVFVVAGNLHAQTLPKVKAGLWETTTSTDGKPTPQANSQMCINDEVMAQMMKMGQSMAQGMCTKQDFSMKGNVAYGSVECKFGQSKMRSTSVTTFSGDSAYRTESKATFNPPMMGMKEGTTVVEGKYVGACKAGMKPGDMMMHGQKMNVLEMTRGAGKK
jgi:Protein of unknown function (DUF3617)